MGTVRGKHFTRGSENIDPLVWMEGYRAMRERQAAKLQREGLSHTRNSTSSVFLVWEDVTR